MIFELIITNITKQKNQRLSKRKNTLLKKSHEIVIFCDANIILYICFRKTSWFIIYRSIDLESWPPSKKQIASICSINIKNYTDKLIVIYLPASSKPVSTRY
jgi:hypothetical protein